MYPPKGSLLSRLKFSMACKTSSVPSKTTTRKPQSTYCPNRVTANGHCESSEFAPRPAEGWSASVGLKGSPAVPLNGRLGRNIDEWLKADLTEQAVMTVTGELIRINFDEHKLFIRHPVTGRQIECTYIPEIEDDIIESRRGFIQVTGEFVLDADGEPLRLTSVTRIEAVTVLPWFSLALSTTVWCLRRRTSGTHPHAR